MFKIKNSVSYQILTALIIVPFFLVGWIMGVAWFGLLGGFVIGNKP